MRRIGALLHEVVIDFFGGEEKDETIVLRLQEGVVVVLLAGEGAGTDDLDLSAFVDEDVGGMHVADLALQMLELLSRPHNIVQQIPHFRLQKVLLQLAPVLDLGLKHELVIVEGQLRRKPCTRTSPPDPQSPTGSKACLRGRKRTSLVSESSICSMERTHSL